MSRLSFKAFVSEAAVESRVLKAAQHVLGTDELHDTSEVDTTTLMKAKRMSHKFVDTPEGPWVVELFTYNGKEFARATPPRELNRKSTYFFINDTAEVAEQVITSVVGEAVAHNVIGPIHSSRQFTYDAATKTFSAEDSSLGHHAFGQLWNDAADSGFGIKSQNTGNVVLFTQDQTHRDRDDDITHWSFTVFNPKNDPALHGLKAVIFND